MKAAISRKTRFVKCPLRAFLLFLTVCAIPCTGVATTLTKTFDFDGFNAVTVFAPYKVTASRGDTFQVQVLVDEEDAAAIDVSKSGPTLYLDLTPGSRQFDVLEAHVTMPVLKEFNIVGASNATLSGFNQVELALDIFGTGRVTGQSMRIDDLSVRVMGTGGVNFAAIDPIQSANVDLNGVIETTLNMDAGSLLAGRMIGVSKLRYWGTNVDLQVISDGQSIIERLGDTRPGAPPGEFRINARLSDAWFNPKTSGQGFTVIVWENIHQVYLSWFTFDTERPPADARAIIGEPGHRWLTALGPYQGDTANLDIFLTTGGVFDSAVPPVNPEEKVGTVTITWTGCNKAWIAYDIPSLGLTGNIPVERIVLDNVPWCEASQ